MINNPQTKQPVELEIEKLVYGGEGLARDAGRVIFLPYVLPGERVRADVPPTRGKNDPPRGRVTELLQPSANRVAAPCPYFGRCGGCHYQHMPYEEQVRQKVTILREVLRRVGKFDVPAEIGTVTAEPWTYRNRVQLRAEQGRLGYHAWGSHELVAIDHCPISSPRLNATIQVLSGMIKDRRWPAFLHELELFTNEDQVQMNVLETERPVARRFFDWCAEAIPGAHASTLSYSAAGRRFRVSPRSFFQVNRFLVDALVQHALGEAAGSTALDLYAGVGLFSLALRDRFSQVTAVESVTSAVRDLEHNAEAAGQAVRIEHQSTEEYLAALQDPPDYVLADPPRAGLGKSVVRDLLRLQPARLTIVSCDPATLARDLAPLLQGGYALAGMTLVDLFPQTYHIETLVQLRRE